MIMLLRVCSLSLVCAYGVVYAQSAAQPESTTSVAAPTESTTSSTVPPAKAAVAKVPKSAEEDVRARGAEWLASCLNDWDRETHMTKQEWARTCQRVTRERVKFLVDQVEQQKATPGLDRRPANVAPR